MLYIELSGQLVHRVVMLSGAAEISCGPDGEMRLFGTEENFRFTSHGIEVKTKVHAKRVADGALEQRDAWISFPYSVVVTVVRTALLPEEEREKSKRGNYPLLRFGIDPSSISTPEFQVTKDGATRRSVP